MACHQTSVGDLGNATMSPKIKTLRLALLSFLLFLVTTSLRYTLTGGDVRVKIVIDSSQKDFGPPPELAALLSHSVNHTRTNRDVIDSIDRLTPTRHTFNSPAIQVFRNQLSSQVHTAEIFILTQSNTRPGDRIPYYKGRGGYNIDKTLYSLQPSSIAAGTDIFNRCSVVGNSGILKDSGCGPQIDGADFIFRLNLFPTVPKFTDDTGVKTHLVTCDDVTLNKKFLNLGEPRWKQAFQNYVTNSRYGPVLILTAPFGRREHTQRQLELQRTVHQQGLRPTVVLGHPLHRNATVEYWHRAGLERTMSNGFYLVSSALSLCTKVTVFGFWPFTEDKQGRPVDFHLAQSMWPHLSHEQSDDSLNTMRAEFQMLLELDRLGLLRLVTDPC
ncbi:tRNA wybutosine-synthesizing protein 2 [Branchiostoma belcheri]|nr:tRNA wybutosine-synthesizing protein 2 [Branchiostoma belcheri]